MVGLWSKFIRKNPQPAAANDTKVIAKDELLATFPLADGLEIQLKGHDSTIEVSGESRFVRRYVVLLHETAPGKLGESLRKKGDTRTPPEDGTAQLTKLAGIAEIVINDIDTLTEPLAKNGIDFPAKEVMDAIFSDMDKHPRRTDVMSVPGRAAQASR